MSEPKTSHFICALLLLQGLCGPSALAQDLPLGIAFRPGTDAIRARNIRGKRESWIGSCNGLSILTKVYHRKNRGKPGVPTLAHP